MAKIKMLQRGLLDGTIADNMENVAYFSPYIQDKLCQHAGNYVYIVDNYVCINKSHINIYIFTC